MKRLLVLFLVGCGGATFSVPVVEEDAGDASQEACVVNYDLDASSPCDSPNPCWQWETTSGILLSKGQTCLTNCLCATPNEKFGKPIACGCGGFCHFGGCLGSK